MLQYRTMEVLVHHSPQNPTIMNAVEFLTSHRVVVNRHARGAPVPHLTDEAVQTTRSELDKALPYTSVKWRGRGGGQPTFSGVEFDRQLDKVSIWLEGWSHPQRCRFLEELLRHSSYVQIQLLHTVLQPSLHRDFMYTVRSRFPDIEFAPVSTYITRELKDKLSRLRLDTFHRVGSAHFQKERDVEPVKLPNLQYSSRSVKSLPNTIASWSSMDKLTCRKEIQSSREEKVLNKERWLEDGFDRTAVTGIVQDAVSRFVEMPVRRHIQEEQMSKKGRKKQKKQSSVMYREGFEHQEPESSESNQRKCKLRWYLKEFRDDSQSNLYSSNGLETARRLCESDTTRLKLPKEAIQIMCWYVELWNDTRRNEFLHKLVLKLDPRQHYFISSLLSLKHHKDIVGLLPEDLALRILKYLSPRELLTACRVSKKWEKLANNNSVWRLKCLETSLEVPIPPKPQWKSVYKDNLYLRLNWNKGLCRATDFKGHTNSVLSVTCDNERLASGSADKTIKIWDLKTGHLLNTLKGHNKGIWCIQFFTKHLLVSGSFDGTIRIWNLRTGQTTRSLLGHSAQVWCLKLRNGLLVSGSQDRTAKLWDIGRCLLLQTLIGHNAAIFAADIAEDKSVVITASADRSVRLWDPESGQARKVVWVSPTTSVMSISYSHGYFACSYDGTVCLYKGGKLIKAYTEHRKRVESVHLHIVDPEKGYGYIISGGKDDLIKYWDTSKDKSVQTFAGHKKAVNCVYVNRLCIASASYDNKIRVWDFNIGMPPKEEEEEDDEEEEAASPKEDEIVS